MGGSLGEIAPPRRRRPRRAHFHGVSFCASRVSRRFRIFRIDHPPQCRDGEDRVWTLVSVLVSEAFYRDLTGTESTETGGVSSRVVFPPPRL